MLLAVQPAFAQKYKYEVGGMLGMTGYLGETNNGNLFKHPSFTVGGQFRYVHNSRWAFKANLNYANLRGNSMYDETWYPDGACGQHDGRIKGQRRFGQDQRNGGTPADPCRAYFRGQE